MNQIRARRVYEPLKSISQDEGGGWRALYSAMVFQAICDTGDPDTFTALEACVWLITDGRMYLEGAGLPNSEVSLPEFLCKRKEVMRKRYVIYKEKNERIHPTT